VAVLSEAAALPQDRHHPPPLSWRRCWSGAYRAAWRAALSKW